MKWIQSHPASLELFRITQGFAIWSVALGDNPSRANMEIEDASPKLDGFNVKCHHPDISLDSNAYLEIMPQYQKNLSLLCCQNFDYVYIESDS